MPARDPADLYKDKIEVSLDGRQIFYLFFGGAVIVGLVFVLGVVVGRRVEARGHVDPARTAAAADPLAALDRLEGNGRGMSFQGALTGTPAPTAVERTIDELERARRAAAPAVAPHGGGGGAPAQGAPHGGAPAVGAPGGAVAPAAAAAPAPEKAEKKPEKAEARAEKSEKAEKAEARAEKSEKSEKSEKAEKKKPAGSKERFTLQLSSFQDRQEAESFVDLLKGAGYQPYVTEAEVNGKGTFYRVRLGSYRSLDAATEAKSDVERVSKKSASVMRL